MRTRALAVLFAAGVSAFAQQPDLEARVRRELFVLAGSDVFDHLEFRLQGGRVTLFGHVVHAVRQGEAEQAVEKIAGVTGVDNRIEVLPRSSQDDRVRLAVYRAIYDHASPGGSAPVPAPSIHIVVNKGMVSLEGSVPTEARRHAAGIEAARVPGVVFLSNDLRIESPAAATTGIARDLVLARIAGIAGTSRCREAFDVRHIDLARLRFTAARTRFYSAVGEEGRFRFSQIAGRPASPDQTLRELAHDVMADAFVLGYFDEGRYVRTRRVVLTRGYFEQPDENDGAPRPTTTEEKQNLLLHELLHIALDKDDDELTQRDLCPLRLLAFCPNSLGEVSRSIASSALPVSALLTGR